MIELPQENWTKFPNCIIDNLPDFSMPEFIVLSFMIRRTLGFHKLEDRFSIRFICHGYKDKETGEQKVKGTGLTANTVQKALDGLQEKRCIELVEKNQKYGNLYKILWSNQDFSVSPNDTLKKGSVSPNDTPVYHQMTRSKENPKENQKNINKAHARDNTETEKTPDEIKPDIKQNPTLHNFNSKKDDTDILEESLPTPRRNKAPDEIPFAVEQKDCFDKIRELLNITTTKQHDIYYMLEIAKKAEYDLKLIEKKTLHFKRWVNSKKNGTATISGLLTNFDWLEPQKPTQQAVKRSNGERKVITTL